MRFFVVFLYNKIRGWYFYHLCTHDNSFVIILNEGQVIAGYVQMYKLFWM
jgi:hypothetical protein